MHYCNRYSLYYYRKQNNKMIPNESYSCIIPLFDFRQKLWLASSQWNMVTMIRSLLWCQVVWLYKSADLEEVNAILWERWWEGYNIARSCVGAWGAVSDPWLLSAGKKWACATTRDLGYMLTWLGLAREWMTLSLMTLLSL